MRKNTKRELLSIAQKISKNQSLTINEVQKITELDLDQAQSKVFSWIKNLSFPISVFIGILLVSFPSVTERIAENTAFLQLSDGFSGAFDYIWSIIGNPVDQDHLIYHVPNIILYSFGIFGIKTLFENINKSSWKDRLLSAKSKLNTNIENGSLNLSMPKGFSVLFVGNGDFIGEEFVRRNPETTVIISGKKPKVTDIWAKYDFEDDYEKLKLVLKLIDHKNVGEYIFFPVIDEQIYLPDENDYDVPPHKLDLIIQNIRAIEKELGIEEKRVIIVGDKYHKSEFITTSSNTIVVESTETLTIEKISQKLNKVSIIDPTDLVSDQINKISKGKKIFFRASKTGISKYKDRFYSRLMETSYHEKTTESITIGYDLYEDLIEQQSITLKKQKYIPVVLTSNVYEALKREGFDHRDIIYVPHLVLREIQEESEKQ